MRHPGAVTLNARLGGSKAYRVWSRPKKRVHPRATVNGKELGSQTMIQSPADDLSKFLGSSRFGTILADPPWRFANRTGKVAPEHNRLSRYDTLSLQEIYDLRCPGMPKTALTAICGSPMLCCHWVASAQRVGIRVQDKCGLAQDPEGRRTRRARGGLLLPECNRTDPVWSARAPRPRS